MIASPRLRLMTYLREHAVAYERGNRAPPRGVASDRGPVGMAGGSRRDTSSRFGSGDDRLRRAWGTYLFLLRDGSSLVGSGGYKGPPRDGVVEVGYEIAPEYRNQGFAAEAKRALIGHSFLCDEVDAVRPTRSPSATRLFASSKWA